MSTSEEPEMQELAGRLRSDRRKVVEVVDDLLQESPWMALPKEARIDHLPDVVDQIVEAAILHEHDREIHLEMAWTAARHGEERRQQGLPDEVLLREYHLLREAIWRQLRKVAPTRALALRAIMRIDSAISTATTACLRGYHRPETDGDREYAAGIRDLVETSPFFHSPRR